MKTLPIHAALRSGLLIIVAISQFSFKVVPQKTTEPDTTQILFPFITHHKTGFLDPKGNIRIAPKFHRAGSFSNGLAPARENGLYGYIGTDGEFMIPPQFDFAYGFKDDLAKVYKDKKPYLINTRGEILFDHEFEAMGEPCKGFVVVRSEGGKIGMVNLKGELVIDTLYANVSYFKEGACLLTEYIPPENRNNDRRYRKPYMGVADTNGNLIIPLGKFTEIKPFHDGYASAELPAEEWDSLEGYSARSVILNKKGDIVLSTTHKNRMNIEGNVQCGLVRKHFSKLIPADTFDGWLDYNSYYDGFINIIGEVVINDTNYTSITDFTENRAFAKNTRDEYLLIDTKGEVCSPVRYTYVDRSGFTNGLAFVQTKDGWGIIDTNGQIIMEPWFRQVYMKFPDERKFIFCKQGGKKEGEDFTLYGLADYNGKILIDASFDDLEEIDWKAGLIRGTVMEVPTIKNFNDEIIWREQQAEGGKEQTTLNIDHMVRGYFYAKSKSEKGFFIPHGGTRNLTQKLRWFGFSEPHRLYVQVEQLPMGVWVEEYKARKVKLVNNTLFPVRFNAQDYRLYMWVEACNNKGEWEAIEYLPSSWCGNSYHTMILPAKNFWEFTTPVYEGAQPTHFRIGVRYVDPEDHDNTKWKRKELTLYSNSWAGTVNPAQFWRKPGYQPRGIMDPYNE